MDGKYSADENGGLTLISAPPETRYFVDLIQSIVDKAQKGAEAEEVIAELEHISPKLSEAARHVIRTGGIRILIALLLSFLSSCDAKYEIKADGNRLIDQLFYHLMGHEPTPEPKQTSDSKIDEKPRREADAPSEPNQTGSVENSAPKKRSEPRQTSDQQSQQSHHKSVQSKRQKRRAAQQCGPRQR